ncbi:MAG: hypothetical protein V7603_4667 [Micromonosporaceae bacterium]
MFASDNRTFVADQRRKHSAADYAMASRGADRLLADVGVALRSLPYYFRLDPATHGALGAATVALVNAQEKLVRHLCSTLSADDLTDMFRVPPAMASRIDWTDVASSRFRMLRADIVPTDSGYYFCEVNHFSGVGGGESYHSARLFAELLGRPVCGVSPFRELAYQYVSECTRAGLARIVILDSARHRRLGYGQHRLLQEYLKLMAPEIEVVYCDELCYRPEWLRRDEAGRTLVHRLVTLDDTEDGGAFLSAVRASGATFSCMFEAELKMHRRWFSLLCDPRYHHLLDEGELAVIQRHVPHTFELCRDNLRATLAAKDDYVFKRSYTYGGEGVLIGRQHSRDDLRQALLAAQVEAWTCQRFVPASTLDLPSADGRTAPFYFVLGMYLYGERTSGLAVRASAGGQVVNASRGGVSWAFAG